MNAFAPRVTPNRRSDSRLPHHQYQTRARWRIRRGPTHSRVAQAAKIPVWCGGMLESGIGRAHNIALQRFPIFLPGRRVREQAVLDTRYHHASRWKPRRTAPSPFATNRLRIRTRPRIPGFAHRAAGIHRLDVRVRPTPENQPQLSLDLERFRSSQRNWRSFQQMPPSLVWRSRTRAPDSRSLESCSRARFPQ